MSKVNRLTANDRSKQSTHRSVLEMTAELLEEEPAAVKALQARLNQRQLVKSLAIVRAKAGLSQVELAQKMGCSQSKISKIENGVDSDLSFGDLAEYLRGVGHEAKMVIIPAGNTLVDEVKMHAFQIKHLLDRMVSLAGDDGTINRGVADFLEEAAINLLGLVRKAAANLPSGPASPNGPIYVDTPESELEIQQRSAPHISTKPNKHQKIEGRV